MVDANHTSSSDEFSEYRELTVSLTSGLRNQASLDINGTTLVLQQHSEIAPMMVELYVEDDSKPIGTLNTARGETVMLGGVEEDLASRIDEIRDLPLDEIPAELEKLAYRLNPAGRDPPTDSTESGDSNE